MLQDFACERHAIMGSPGLFHLLHLIPKLQTEENMATPNTSCDIGGGIGGLFTALELLRSDITLSSMNTTPFHAMLYDYLIGEVMRGTCPKYTDLLDDRIRYQRRHQGRSGARQSALISMTGLS